MRKAWLMIGMFALASTACSHPQIDTGVAPSDGTVRASRPASETLTALYMVDGILVIDGVLVAQPIASVSPPPASPLLVIDGVPIGSPTP
jgi:hypothetical protein